MDNKEAQQWADIIDPIAKSVASEYPDVEWEDLSQHLWIRVLESGAQFKVDGKHTKSVLRFAGRKEAGRIRNYHLTITAQYAYRTADVRKLLEVYYDKSKWGEATVPEDAQSELGPVQYEIMGDLSSAYSRLPDNYQAIILRKYFLNDDLEVSERKLLSRAIGRVAELMNSYRGQVEQVGRRATSNASAMATIQDEYGGR